LVFASASDLALAAKTAAAAQKACEHQPIEPALQLAKAKPSSPLRMHTTHQEEDGMPTDEILIRLLTLLNS
jgi:hypothetical protein